MTSKVEDEELELPPEWKTAVSITPRDYDWIDFCIDNKVDLTTRQPAARQKYLRAQKAKQVKHRLLGTEPTLRVTRGQADWFKRKASDE